MISFRRPIAFTLVAAAGLAGAGIVWDLQLSYRRISKGSRAVASPFGDIEYSRGGAGPTVLVIHGSGGGFDQGKLLPRPCSARASTGSLLPVSVTCVRLCPRAPPSTIRPRPTHAADDGLRL